MPRYSAAQLTSAKILTQRSAVPAVFSRTTTTTRKRKHGLSREEKDRLMRIAKRPRKGPFNSIMDPSDYAADSGTVALSEAVMYLFLRSVSSQGCNANNFHWPLKLKNQKPKTS